MDMHHVPTRRLLPVIIKKGENSMKRVIGPTVIAIMVLLATACSSSSKAGSSSPTSSPSTSNGATSGPQIPIMLIEDLTNPAISYPSAKGAAEAAVDNFNAAGGVHGRQVKLIVCDEQLTPAIAQACARQALQDHVVVAGTSIAATQSLIVPILKPAGIPFVDSNPIDPNELNNSDVFPTLSGTQGFSAAAPQIMKNEGCKSVGMVRATDFPTSQPDAATFQQAATSAGYSSAKVVGTLSTNQNVSGPIAQLASDGVDCAYTELNATQLVSVATSAHQQSPPIRLVTYLNGQISILAKLPTSVSNGISLIGPAADPSIPGSPEVQEYMTEMSKYAPGQDATPTPVFDAWGVTKVMLGALLNATGDFTAASVTAGLKATTEPAPGQAFSASSTTMFGPVSFGNAQVAGHSSWYNPYEYWFKLDNGTGSAAQAAPINVGELLK